MSLIWLENAVPSAQQAIFQKWREGAQIVFECGEKAAGTVRGGRLVRWDGAGFAKESTAATQTSDSCTAAN
jgi:hypothetical protein